MIHRARLINILLAFQLILANSIQLEHSIIPIINSQDINNNGKIDFLATNNSVTPRTLYWFEVETDSIKQLWTYNMPERKAGYFSDMILGDFDNDGISELISLAYQENKSEIFYIFYLDSLKSNFSNPTIIGLNNSKNKIVNPHSIQLLPKLKNNIQPFLLIQGSPNKQVIMCEFINSTINEIGVFGEKYLNQSSGPISIVVGNFNDDKIEDVFILSNGVIPEGYFIYSNGKEKKLNLNNYPHFNFIKEKGLDINGDGIDELIMLDKNGNLMSDLWEGKSISLLDSSINSIFFKIENGLISINSVNKHGTVHQLIIDPLTVSMVTSDIITSKFINTDSLIINSLINENEILMISEEKKSQIAIHPLNNKSSIINDEKDFIEENKTYDKPPDFIIQLGDDFIHSITTDTSKSFLYFVGKKLPLGMEFDLNDIDLKWTPIEKDLGYHKLLYSLELREKGNLEIAVQGDIQSVSQQENIIDGEFSYLIYVNDPIKFNSTEQKITIVNKDYHEEPISIYDSNNNVIFNLEILNNDNDAKFILTDLNENMDSIKQTMPLKADSINNNNVKGLFSWTPNTQADSAIFTLLANDGYSSDTLNLTIYIHPEIDLTNNDIDYEYTVNQSIIIPINVDQFEKSKKYDYDLIRSPENMWVNDEGVIHWIPLQTQIDNHLIDLKVSDGIASSILSLEININAIPVISSRPSEQFYLNLDDSLSFSLESFDMNMDPTLNWKLVSGPEGMILNDEGILKWKGNMLDYHSYDIQLSDGIDSVRWIGSIYVNDIPLIISEPKKMITADSLYEYIIEVKDDNKISSINSSMTNNIQYELLLGPDAMKIDNNKIYWQADPNTSETYDIAIKASDGMDESIQKFQLKVNSLPVFTSLDSTSVMYGDSLRFIFNANDFNVDDSLIYSMDDKKPKMTLNEKSGLLTWIPSKLDIGEYDFNIQVLDGHENSGTNQKFKVLVYDLPTFTGDLLTEAFAGLEFAGFISGRDMYEKKLRDDMSILIDSTSIKNYALSEYGRYFQWTPLEEDIGEHSIKIKIIDEMGFVSYHTHYLSVFRNPCYQCKDDSIDSPIDTTKNK